MTFASVIQQSGGDRSWRTVGRGGAPAPCQGKRKSGQWAEGPECVRTGASPERVSLRPACRVWVPDCVWERFHNTSPGDFESMFTKAGDGETRERRRVEGVMGESLGGAAVVP